MDGFLKLLINTPNQKIALEPDFGRRNNSNFEIGSYGTKTATPTCIS